MLLSDTIIKAKITANKLIEDHDETNIESCAYTFRIGKVFKPSTGECITPEDTTKRIVYELNPSETLIVMTKERINMPVDLCGDYSIKNSLAAKGILMLNASIVLPGYQGYLSCFLLNFSNQKIILSKHEEIARMVFHQLSTDPAKTETKAFNSAQYDKLLSENSVRFSSSFMNIGNIEEQVLKKSDESIRKNIKFGGIIVGILLLWSTLQPIVTRAFWGGEIYVQSEEVQKQKKELEDFKKELINTVNLYKVEQQRTLELKKIQEQLDELSSKFPKKKGN